MKFLQYIGILVLSLLIASCNSGSDVSDGSGSGSTEVSVSIGERSGGGSAELSPELFPAEIISFKFTVTGPNMDPMEQIVNVVGTNPITVIFIVPNGYRCFSIYASDAPDGEGTVLYSGVTCQDIGGGPETVTVFMRLQLVCDLYVDMSSGIDTPDCTDSNNPCQTITYALTQTTGNEAICVAAGMYDGEMETFPLNLKPGTSLICQGADYTTVITVDWETAIAGAPGASIEGCNVTVGDSGDAINDSGAIITVENCLIEGTGGFGNVGIAIQADSTVSNSIIRNFSELEGGGEGIYVSGGSPTISNNTITGNRTGIYVWEAGPTISNNEIYCNDDADLISDSSTQVIATNNSWDHDDTTIPTGPTLDSTGSCWGGVDICYWSGAYGGPEPLYVPFNPAVPGGCLPPSPVSKE